MKQGGNLNFDFVKPIECVVLILVYRQQQQQKNDLQICNSVLVSFEKDFWFLKGHTELKIQLER